MYYHAMKETGEVLYTHEEEAVRYLFTLTARLAAKNIILLDYLLEPKKCHLLLHGGTITHFEDFTIKKVQVNNLLHLFSYLGSKGKSYPYSGLHECYFRSPCFCELGKVGFEVLPFSLKEVLAVKHDQR